MQMKSPEFMEWIIIDERGWTVKKNAPDWVAGAIDKFWEDAQMVEPITE